jgi:hypothetical protein
MNKKFDLIKLTILRIIIGILVFFKISDSVWDLLLQQGYYETEDIDTSNMILLTPILFNLLIIIPAVILFLSKSYTGSLFFVSLALPINYVFSAISYKGFGPEKSFRIPTTYFGWTTLIEYYFAIISVYIISSLWFLKLIGK